MFWIDFLDDTWLLYLSHTEEIILFRIIVFHIQVPGCSKSFACMRSFSSWRLIQAQVPPKTALVHLLL